MADLESLFPGLRGSGYLITSPEDIDYNCVAWAADDEEHWWWPEAALVAKAFSSGRKGLAMRSHRRISMGDFPDAVWRIALPAYPTRFWWLDTGRHCRRKPYSELR